MSTYSIKDLEICKQNMEKYKHRILNKHKDDITDAVYCGRGSLWGNNYSHLPNTEAQFKVGSREEAVVMHRYAFISAIKSGDIEIKALTALANKKVYCYCSPALCHCSTILAVADYFKEKQNV